MHAEQNADSYYNDADNDHYPSRWSGPEQAFP